MSARPVPEPDRVERRNGEDGPEQPMWENVALYSAEWYRRFIVWHGDRYPTRDAETVTNLLMEYGIALDREAPTVGEVCEVETADGWVPGTVEGLALSLDQSEHFRRLNVRGDDGKVYTGCHPMYIRRRHG